MGLAVRFYSLRVVGRILGGVLRLFDGFLFDVRITISTWLPWSPGGL